MSPAPDPSVRDPARQPERTRLAWRRTVLAVTVVGILTVRMAVVGPTSPLRLLVVAAVLAGWVLVVAASWRRIRRMTQPVPPAPRWSVPAVTLVVVGYAGLATALVMMP